MSTKNKEYIRIICIRYPETAGDIQFNLDNWTELGKEDKAETIKAGHELFKTKTLKELKIAVKKELEKQAREPEVELILDIIDGVISITAEKIKNKSNGKEKENVEKELIAV